MEGDDYTGGREVLAVCLRSTPGGREEREISLSGSILTSCPGNMPKYKAWIPGYLTYIRHTYYFSLISRPCGEETWPRDEASTGIFLLVSYSTLRY